jgi:hypothetical protein
MSSYGYRIITASVWVALFIGCENAEESPARAISSQSQSSTETEVSVPSQLQYEVVEVPDGGQVRGRVRISGPTPNLEDLLVGKDQGVCGETTPNRSLRLGREGGVEGAVVTLAGITSGVELRPLPGVAKIEITKCRLFPHVLLVPLGSTLEIVNNDSILHDIRAHLGETMLFDVALPIQHFRAQRSLELPGIVNLTSGAGHTWVSGYVVVKDHPYYASTDARGAYTIDAIPPGTYDLRVWHEFLDGEKSVLIVEPETTATVDFSLEVPRTGVSGNEK